MHSNCWEYKQCGREPGGVNVDRRGVCPAAIENKFDTINNGKNAGRVCWMVAGTLCGKTAEGTYAQKYKTCKNCDFYKVVNYFETIFCNALEGICIFDNHGVLIDRNERMIEIIGQRLVPGKTKVEDLNRFPVYNLDMSPITDHQNPLLQSWKQKKAMRNNEFVFLPFPNTQKYIENNVVPITSEDGTSLLIAFYRDVTHKKIMAETLANSEKKYRHIFNANLMGVFFFDIKNNILEGNDQFLDLIGYTNEDIDKGLNWIDLIYKNNELANKNLSGELLTRGQIGPIEMLLQRKNANQIPVSFSAAYFPEQKTCLGIINDISEQQRLDDMRTNFITTVSHELRTPMTSLLCYIKVLINSQHLNSEDQGFLEIAERNAKRLATLINTILEVERLEMGPNHVKREKVDMGAICNSVLETVSIQAQVKNIDLLTELGSLKDFMIEGVSEDLQQMISNLLTNAVKYTMEGFVKLSLSWSKSKKEIFITVQDTGVGLKPDELSKIFEGFYRAKHDVNTKVPGSGLGLRIVKDIIERHNGKIKVVSEPDKGTTVTVKLPKSQTDITLH